MSVYHIQATIEALLQDETDGLKATLVALIPTLVPAPVSVIRTDFNFVPWAFGKVVNPLTSVNVMFRPNVWGADEKLSTNQRDGDASIEIGVEMSSADPREIQDNLTIIATALVQCAVDKLRAYSDAHNGTIVDVVDPLRVQFGEFTGGVTSGFLARVTVTERSSA